MPLTKNLSSKYEEETRLKMRLEYSGKISFLGSNFFQRSLETFLWTLRTCSRYLKGPPNLDLCISKRIVTARLTDQNICQEKPKVLRFWKNEAQNQVGIFWQSLMFWVETFFQMPLENFQWTVRTCSRYLEGPPVLVLCISKKIRAIWRVEMKILQERYEKLEKEP